MINTDPVQQGLEIVKANPERAGVGVSGVRCGACKIVVRDWAEFLQHVLDYHQDDEHRTVWAQNALADLVEREERCKQEAECRRLEELAKQDRLNHIRARVSARQHAQQITIQRKRERVARKASRASGSKHSWLYWLFTPRPSTVAPNQGEPLLALPPPLTSDEALRRVAVMNAARVATATATATVTTVPATGTPSVETVKAAPRRVKKRHVSRTT